MLNDFKRKKDEFRTPSIHLILGNCYRLKSDLDDAIKEFRKAIKMNPDYLEAHCSLAKAYLEKAKKEAKEPLKERRELFKNAVMHFKKAQKLSPSTEAVQELIKEIESFHNKSR